MAEYRARWPYRDIAACDIVMGNPLTPLLWLAEELRRWGQGLHAGEMISTGSATGMMPIREGKRVRALFGGDARVEIRFGA